MDAEFGADPTPKGLHRANGYAQLFGNDFRPGAISYQAGNPGFLACQLIVLQIKVWCEVLLQFVNTRL